MAVAMVAATAESKVGLKGLLKDAWRVVSSVARLEWSLVDLMASMMADM